MDDGVRRCGIVLFAAVLGGVLGGCDRGGRLAPRAGRRLYAEACARCHGLDGRGGRPLAPGRPAPRDFHDPDFQRTRSDADLRAVVSGGRGIDMPPFKTVFEARQIDALVARVRGFAPKR